MGRKLFFLGCLPSMTLVLGFFISHGARVIFIPKVGKPSHTKAGDYRPISLCSFLRKLLERILDVHIRASIYPLLLFQHAHTRSKSVETAPHSLTSRVEKSLHVKEYTLAVFLDIEGAFNNVNPVPLVRALNSLNLDQNLVRFTEFLLKSHKAVFYLESRSQLTPEKT